MVSLNKKSMFGLDNEDEERMWNMLLFKMPLTDKELEDASPAIGITILILIVAVIVWLCLK